MRVFRIEREQYLSHTLKGFGAALSDGFRWNSLNIQLVYAAESRALALLEIAMHLDLSEDLPDDRLFVEIDIPNNVTVLAVQKNDLPNEWDAKPPTSETQYFGDDFVLSQKAAVLQVPSAIIPEEHNYLINPNHPEASELRIVSTKPLNFDKRLKSR